MLLCEGFLALSGADHVLKYAGVVLLQPPYAAIELASLPRGDNYETEAHLLQFLQTLQGTGNWRCIV